MENIQTKNEYDSALIEIQHLWDSKPGSAESDRLHLLIKMVEEYEHKMFEMV